MKRLIFFVMVLCSTVYSAENIQIAWQNDWKEVGTHGIYKAEWTKNIKIPEGCTESEERRLDKIVLVSTNIIHKKPTEWLEGKYLDYVNSSCDIWDSLRGTPEDFEKVVNKHFEKKQKKESTNNGGFMAFVLLLLAFGTFHFINLGIGTVNNRFK